MNSEEAGVEVMNEGERVLRAHQARYAEQKKEWERRAYTDVTRTPNPQNLHFLFVYRDGAWQEVGFVMAVPNQRRVQRWRRRFGIRKGETCKLVDLHTAQQPLDSTPPVVRVPESRSPLRTLQAALVVMPEAASDRPFWSAQVLGAGSVVALAGKGISPLTGNRTEIRVQWADAAGRVSFGYLARTAAKWLSPFVDRGVVAPRYVSAARATLSALDTIRHTAGMTEGWRITSWVRTFATPDRIPQLHATIRELGGTVPRSVDPALAARLVVRYLPAAPTRTTTTESTTMAKKAQQEAAAADVEAALATAEVTRPSKKSKKSKKSTKAPSKAAKSTKATKSTKAAKAAKAPKAAKSTKAETATRPGRASGYAGMVIVKLVDKNPRREGTHGFNSWALLRKGMTYEQYIAAGGRRVDLWWDIEHGNTKVVKPSKAK